MAEILLIAMDDCYRSFKQNHPNSKQMAWDFGWDELTEAGALWGASEGIVLLTGVKSGDDEKGTCRLEGMKH